MKKLLACIFLILDHIGLYYADVLPAKLCIAMRVIGSLALPLFAYSFAFGFTQTRSAKNYFLRILFLAFFTQTLLFLLLPATGIPYESLPLNSVFALLCGFVVLYGCELLFATPPDRIGSLRLLVENAQTHSDRFDIRIGHGVRAGTYGPGVYIPELPLGAQFSLGIGLIAAGVVAAFLFPIEYGVLTVLSVLLFYIIEKRIPKNQSTWAFFVFLLLIASYLVIFYLMTGEVSLQGAGIAAIFLCYLPARAKRPSRAIQAAFYVFFPLHVLVLLLLRLIL